MNKLERSSSGDFNNYIDANLETNLKSNEHESLKVTVNKIYKSTDKSFEPAGSMHIKQNRLSSMGKKFSSGDKLQKFIQTSKNSMIANENINYIQVQSPTPKNEPEILEAAEIIILKKFCKNKIKNSNLNSKAINLTYSSLIKLIQFKDGKILENGFELKKYELENKINVVDNFIKLTNFKIDDFLDGSEFNVSEVVGFINKFKANIDNQLIKGSVTVYELNDNLETVLKLIEKTEKYIFLLSKYEGNEKRLKKLVSFKANLEGLHGELKIANQYASLMRNG